MGLRSIHETRLETSTLLVYLQSGLGSPGYAEMGFWAMGKRGVATGEAGKGQSGLVVPWGHSTEPFLPKDIFHRSEDLRASNQRLKHFHTFH